jgi:hypothetical protein
MYVPRWLPWLALTVVMIWLMTDPQGLAAIIGDVWNGIVTFFRALS